MEVKLELLIKNSTVIIDKFVGFHPFLVNILNIRDISKNVHINFKNIPKTEFDHSQKIVISDNNDHVFWLELLIAPKLWTFTKAAFATKMQNDMNL